MASMTIEWVPGDGSPGAWWIKISGTCVLPLYLSARATRTEVRMLAAQTLSDMANKAEVSGT